MFTETCEEMLDFILNSFGVTPELLSAPDAYVPVLPEVIAEERRRMKCAEAATGRILRRFVDDFWYAANRVKHTSVGQEKRDLWRAIAKIEGMSQVTSAPRVYFESP